MNNKMLVLSAGKGTRMGNITQNVPKVMVPFLGKPLLGYQIEHFKRKGITEICINTHYLADQIFSYVGDGSKFHIKIHTSYEPEILGTAGALHNFKHVLKETFFVFCGDILADFDLNSLLSVHRKNKAVATIFVDRARPFKDKGIVLVSGEKVIGFKEKPKEDIPGSYINSGLYVFEPEIFSFLPEGFSDFGKDIFPLLAQKEVLYATFHDGYLFDIGTTEDYAKAESFFKK